LGNVVKYMLILWWANTCSTEQKKTHSPIISFPGKNYQAMMLNNSLVGKH